MSSSLLETEDNSGKKLPEPQNEELHHVDTIKEDETLVLVSKLGSLENEVLDDFCIIREHIRPYLSMKPMKSFTPIVSP